jgi:hypothetical protein
MHGQPLPEAEVKAVVLAIAEAVLSSPGGFSAWRYGCALGREQLRGLSETQVEIWRTPTEMGHAGGKLRTHEGGSNELGFFWATKIGGPSHGFDFESQCILPLLANARHKVILVNDAEWPDHPAGRAHWRLLWAIEDSALPQYNDGAVTGDEEECSSDGEPRLWLEPIQCCFAAAAHGINHESWRRPVLHHAISKADALGVALSLDERDGQELMDMFRIGAYAQRGTLREVSERIILRPSNGVVEASDYLSPLHDWAQVADEITAPIGRVLYIPPGV